MKISKEFLVVAVLFPIIAHSARVHSYPFNEAQRTLLDAILRNRDNKRSVETDYSHLCEIERNVISLNIGDQEFYPPLYTEIWCKHTIAAKSGNSESKICARNYHCVQQYAPLYVMKKSQDPECESSTVDVDGCTESQCWKIEKREVAAGCECMWPNNILGDKK